MMFSKKANLPVEITAEPILENFIDSAFFWCKLEPLYCRVSLGKLNDRPAEDTILKSSSNHHEGENVGYSLIAIHRFRVAKMFPERREVGRTRKLEKPKVLKL